MSQLVQVRANKSAAFEAITCESHVQGLVDGLVASRANYLLCFSLVDLVASLVAEPEKDNTPEHVQKCVSMHGCRTNAT
jgi:hypothetical protein